MTERDADRARRDAEEARAIELLAAAKRARRQAGRVEVAEWPWQVPKRRPAAPPPLDIVAIARAALSEDEDGEP
jgi:hypothetical protein